MWSTPIPNTHHLGYPAPNLFQVELSLQWPHPSTPWHHIKLRPRWNLDPEVRWTTEKFKNMFYCSRRELCKFGLSLHFIWPSQNVGRCLHRRTSSISFRLIFIKMKESNNLSHGQRRERKRNRLSKAITPPPPPGPKNLKYFVGLEPSGAIAYHLWDCCHYPA